MSAQVLIFVIILLPNIVIASLSVSSTTLTTTLGQVIGIRKTTGNNKKIDIFYSIPFAMPPVGDLRFRHPLPAEPWVGALDGTQKPKSCWQSIDTAFGRFPGVEMWNPNTQRSEDCLHLNVWRPVCSESCSENRPKSILVWIFGGGFYSGTTTLDIYDGTQLSVLNDVVVVSIAYRLGPLGFLYTESQDAPGNAGLFDQALALKWVKDNAVNLGGSPDSITIFGESAGAASVGFHLFSPVTRDLFNYAILQSASPFADWAIHENDLAVNISLKLASVFSCPTNNVSASINCLRSVDPEDLIDNQWVLTTDITFPFAPVVDNYFLPDSPLKMAQKGDFKNTSVLLGVNKNEGIYFNIYEFPDDLPLDGEGVINEDQLDKDLPKYFNHDKATSEIVKKEYIKTYNNSYTAILDAVRGDKDFKCPVVNFADVVKEHGSSVFLYSFEQRMHNNPWPYWSGVPHGYELELIFGIPLAPCSSYTDEEKALSIRMMQLWTTFAKTGNPNSVSSNEWHEYTQSSKEYVVIDSDGLTVEHRLRESQCSFLADLTYPGHKPELPSGNAPALESRTVDDANLDFTRQAF